MRVTIDRLAYCARGRRGNGLAVAFGLNAGASETDFDIALSTMPARVSVCDWGK
jgi:hypothetical protein